MFVLSVNINGQWQSEGTLIYEWLKNCLSSGINPVAVHSSESGNIRIGLLGDDRPFLEILPGDVISRFRTVDVECVILSDLDKSSEAAWDSLLWDLEDPKVHYVITVSDFYWLPEALRSRVKATNFKREIVGAQIADPVISFFAKPVKDFKSSDQYHEFLGALRNQCRLNPTKDLLELYSRILRVPSLNSELHAKTLCE
jgi:hypothetical protein